jgi:ribosomal protein L11 methyltransferase
MSKENEPASPEAWTTLVLAIPPGTMTREALAELADRLDSLGALLAGEAGVGGVETRDATVLEAAERPTLVVYTTPDRVDALRERASLLAGALDLALETTTKTHIDDTWRDEWKKFYQPMRFGLRLTIRPSWIEREATDERAQLVLDPGRAFGTGLHESTRLCLDTITERPAHAERVLDLGCGSGILGLACLAMDPGTRVTAVDIDPEATATTRENAELNRLEDRLETLTGPVEAVPSTRFRLVLANIRPEALIPAAATIADRVAPGGTLILSGILTEEADEVAEAYAHLGQPERSSLGEWTALRWDDLTPASHTGPS